jgi:LemA protein
MLYGSLAALVVVLIVVLYVAATYNTFVTLRNRFKNAFAQIDVQLKRRYDLIPNLVEAVKGYMAHEKQTLEAVITARNAAMSAAGEVAGDPTSLLAMSALMSAETNLGAALGRFRMLSEAYPDLKANHNTATLMEELSSTENRIAFARQAYNDAVMTYNTRRDTFPTNVMAGPFGFESVPLFQIENASERENVKVKLA